jgi:acyl-CoA thioesterase-1
MPMHFLRAIIFAAVLVGVSLAATGLASAQIVAFGHSAVRGPGGDLSQMWPAQLQAMLRAKGSNVHITNAGVLGENTGKMLARVSRSVPAGTRIVILAVHGANDVRDHINPVVTAANIAAIKEQLSARGIKIIDAMGIYLSVTRQPGMLLPDHRHLNVDGNRQVATILAGMVS